MIAPGIRTPAKKMSFPARDRPFWPVVLGVVAVVLFSGGLPPAPAAVALSPLQGPKPNLLFVLTDDQRVDSMAVMPATARNFDLVFTRATVTTPLCCPSRATFLTGEYAHNHGVWSNHGYPQFRPREHDSLGPWLQRQGYYTGLIGKYLNRYPGRGRVPPGWDEFYARVWGPTGGMIGDGYTSLALREWWMDGLVRRDEIVRYPNERVPKFYSTRYFASLAVRFIKRAESLLHNPLGKPWALFVWPYAPHDPFVPEARYRSAAVPPFRPPPSFLERDLSDKPRAVGTTWMRERDASVHRWVRAQQLRMLMSVDDLVRRTFRQLDRLGVREQTWGLYASDNGFFWGEHGLTRKVFAYEEGMRVPFRMHVPGRGPGRIDALVSNLDVAPTFTELAGDTGRHRFRGRSLLKLVWGVKSKWRSSALAESRSIVHFDALRTARWKYVRWVRTGARELYDLWADPYELRNVAVRYPRVVRILDARVDRLSVR